ncbi:ribose-phosphate pyrophosphokinase [Vigna unguiculata]|uniref:ribose-phosphate diphosphokinase n=1 Tax=Vigna unguiculata TaxID=3917 RepID=A0A4D6MSX7_VIGUN|nr:ribose-phosphate pyrophosphokinase [Vigna unguiculata]
MWVQILAKRGNWSGGKEESIGDWLKLGNQEIACYLGLELGKIKIKRFADGEIYVQLQESVRGCDVFLVQPTCPPANENLMELLIMIDACRRASAKNITAVIPYFGYARADRKTQGRESIAAKLVANLITEAGANRVLACDLHSGQSMGYFDIPVDHVYGQPVILDYLASKTICSDDLVVVSPDVGGVARARAFAKKLSDAPLAIVDKRRHGHNVAEVMNLIGDVRGKVAVMVDDMIDTAGTIAKGAALLHQEGAREVYACTTHAVFSPPAIERLSSGLFQEVIITNTIPVAEQNYFPQLTVLSVANLLGETVWRVHDDCSVSSIFLVELNLIQVWALIEQFVSLVCTFQLMTLRAQHCDENNGVSVHYVRSSCTSASIKPKSFTFFKRVDVEEDVEEECGDETKQQLEVTKKEVSHAQKKLVAERRKGLILLLVLCWTIMTCLFNVQPKSEPFSPTKH